MKKLLKRLKLNKKGFTFAECIAAIALFAIVGTLAFTMFNTATRYMSKAKKEEAKRAQAQEKSLVDTYTYNGAYIIFPHKVLQVSYIATDSGNVKQYSATLNYDTDYGKVSYAVSIEPTAVQSSVPGMYAFTRYVVTSDKGTKRYIFIYDDDNVDYDLDNEQELINHTISKQKVSEWFRDGQ